MIRGTADLRYCLYCRVRVHGMSAGIQAWGTERTRWFCTRKWQNFLESWKPRACNSPENFAMGFQLSKKFRHVRVKNQRVLADLHALAVRSKRSVSYKNRLLMWYAAEGCERQGGACWGNTDCLLHEDAATQAAVNATFATNG